MCSHLSLFPLSLFVDMQRLSLPPSLPLSTSKGKKATRGKKAASKEGSEKTVSTAAGRKRRENTKATGMVVEMYYEYMCNMS